MGNFRKKPIQRSFEYGGSPASSPRLVNKVLDGREVVVVVDSDFSDVSKSMPVPEEYELEEQLKNGYNPQKINPHGLIPPSDYELSEAIGGILSSPVVSSEDASINVNSIENSVELKNE